MFSYFPMSIFMHIFISFYFNSFNKAFGGFNLGTGFLKGFEEVKLKCLKLLAILLPKSAACSVLCTASLTVETAFFSSAGLPDFLCFLL